MQKQIEMVEQFQKKFNQKVGEEPNINVDGVLRTKLMSEEISEYLDASYNKNIVGIADALGDILYLVYGTIIEHGMQDVIEDVFNEIHRSNMSKLDENGKPIFREDGKIIKGKNYFEPNLKNFFQDNLLIKELEEMLEEILEDFSGFDIEVYPEAVEITVLGVIEVEGGSDAQTEETIELYLNGEFHISEGLQNYFYLDDLIKIHKILKKHKGE